MACRVKRIPVLFLLVPILFLGSCAGGPPRKSVIVGELCAIFPGLVIHGLGHRYAGNVEKANEILAMEAYSILTAGLGGGLVAVGQSEDADAVTVAGWIGVGSGALGFIGTWLYDIIYTPSEVAKYNRRMAAGFREPPEPEEGEETP